MSEELKLCPICEKGHLHEREYHERKAPLYFAECDACGSEQADAEHLRKNKRAYEAEIEQLSKKLASDLESFLIMAKHNVSLQEVNDRLKQQLSVALEVMQTVYHSVSCKVECKQRLDKAIQQIQGNV